jgi:hypothetical protein
MRSNLFKFLVLILVFNVIFSNTKSNKIPTETKPKSKELDISEDFMAEILYKLGKIIKINFFKLNYKLNIFVYSKRQA